MTPAQVDIRTRPSTTAPLGLVAHYAEVVVEVSDLARARRFYELLGLTAADAAADRAHEGLRLRFRGGDAVVLAERERPRVSPEGGTHVAFRLVPDELSAVTTRLERAGVTIQRYHEDRPAERADDRYCADPDGNRLQLVSADASGIDHAAVETHDLEWAETFYAHVLGGQIEHRVGWRMEDYARAWEWGAERDACAPGTRRWDKRYTSIEGEARLPRPNAHFFAALGPEVVLGVYLATEHRQEPPPDRFRGTPRIVFRSAPGALGEIERRLRDIRLRCQRASAFGGPFEREGDSVFARDPGGNFLEFRA